MPRLWFSWERFFRLLPVVLAIAMTSTSVRAEWYQVSSNHFVIYGEGNEEKLRRFSEQLELFHGAMGFVTGRSDSLPSPSNRVTIFVVRSLADVRKLYGGGTSALNIGGYYRPSAGQTIAVVPQVSGDTNAMFNMTLTTLLHEYAHHFLISGDSFPAPRWAGEGAAEFFASVSFESDGGVHIGRPNGLRGLELVYARDVTVSDLIDAEAYERRRGKSTAYDAFYGKSWLLYHYLSLEEQRKGQLQKYYSGLMAGKSSPQAAAAAFGDLETLERELDAYAKRRKLLSIVVNGAALNPGPINLSTLSAGEAAMMPIKLVSQNGVTPEQAGKLVADARVVAERFPGDAAVLAALAEAEFDAGNDAEAIAAAEAALKLDRTQVNAHVQKGFALFRIAEKGSDSKAYRAARSAWIDLNRLENDHPLPLIYFYRSYRSQGQEPPPLAVQGLTRAAQLAPFDLGLRMTLAMQQLHDGQPQEARNNLVPVAYNPHGGNLASAARKAIERLDREPGWRGEGAVIPEGEDAESPPPKPSP